MSHVILLRDSLSICDNFLQVLLLFSVGLSGATTCDVVFRCMCIVYWMRARPSSKLLNVCYYLCFQHASASVSVVTSLYLVLPFSICGAAWSLRFSIFGAAWCCRLARSLSGLMVVTQRGGRSFYSLLMILVAVLKMMRTSTRTG